MDPAPRERPRAVTIVGWIWLIASALRCVNGVLGLVVWKAGGLDRGVPFLAPRPDQFPAGIPGLELMVRYATEILVLQVLVSGAVAYAAFELLRLKEWARRAIVAASGIGIVLAACGGAYVYATTAAMAAQTPEAGAQIRMAGAAAGIFLALLGAAFFGLTIYVLRKAATRRAFARP